MNNYQKLNEQNLWAKYTKWWQKCNDIFYHCKLCQSHEYTISWSVRSTHRRYFRDFVLGKVKTRLFCMWPLGRSANQKKWINSFNSLDVARCLLTKPTIFPKTPIQLFFIKKKIAKKTISWVIWIGKKHALLSLGVRQSVKLERRRVHIRVSWDINYLKNYFDSQKGFENWKSFLIKFAICVLILKLD